MSKSSTAGSMTDNGHTPDVTQVWHHNYRWNWDIEAHEHCWFMKPNLATHGGLSLLRNGAGAIIRVMAPANVKGEIGYTEIFISAENLAEVAASILEWTDSAPEEWRTSKGNASDDATT